MDQAANLTASRTIRPPVNGASRERGADDGSVPATGGVSPPAGPRKVAIILSGLGPGGTERVASLIANHWARHGRDVTVVTLDPPEAVSFHSFDPRVVIQRLGLPAGPATKLRAAWMVLRRVAAIRRGIRELSPDLVVAFLTRQSILTLIATLGMDVPVVVSERSNPELQWPGRAWEFLRQKLYPRAFSLVVMTEGARDYFSPAVRARSRIIPNPVELPTGWHARRERNRLVAVGRLLPVKGFDLLIRAFATVAADFPDWRLVIWGEGPERWSLEQLRDELRLQDRVDLPGLTDAPAAWVETADAFVLSSRYEGFPNALLEAMAAGLAVVSFDCRWGPRQIISHDVDGLLVAPNDVQALGQALAQVMRNPALRHRMGEAAQASSQRYAPDAIMALWDDLLSTVDRR